MHPKVDLYISKSKNWPEVVETLRKLILECQLTEELKWGKPCYSFQATNVLIIQEFKEYCALGFFKGALLQDPNGILKKPGENSQAMRQIRFTNVQDIVKMKAVLKAYIYEAIGVEKVGLKVTFKNHSELQFPEELQNKLDNDAAFKNAFESLTPGRQRAYHLFFSAPKQSATRVSRIEKYVPQILNGKGINDCTCGFSKKMPQCDGSHKYIR